MAEHGETHHSSFHSIFNSDLSSEAAAGSFQIVNWLGTPDKNPSPVSYRTEIECLLETGNSHRKTAV
ncbi:hypothetical protein [Mesobacillus foraminis]|uniref:hypothetical protein n=1 Tax=Mesobacillus foraminis TaxID=279826 RepID=UPI001053D7BB|nr:hypothetical protein [Mesobacillus foraminis]